MRILKKNPRNPLEKPKLFAKPIYAMRFDIKSLAMTNWKKTIPKRCQKTYFMFVQLAIINKDLWLILG